VIRVEFVELAGRSLEPWPQCDEAPQVNDEVEILPEGDLVGHEVVFTVVRRQWFDAGRGVVCYVEM
jgi:hypothetical protein